MRLSCSRFFFSLSDALALFNVQDVIPQITSKARTKPSKKEAVFRREGRIRIAWAHFALTRTIASMKKTCAGQYAPTPNKAPQTPMKSATYHPTEFHDEKSPPLIGFFLAALLEYSP